MKVAQLTYSANPSSACVKLSHALNDLGVKSDIIAVESHSDVDALLIQEDIVDKSIRHAKYLYEKAQIRLLYPHKTGMFFDKSDYGVSWRILNKIICNYDIINLHYINGMLSYDTIRKLSKERKKIVWTMHDCWAFTGGCHHGCDGYMVDCGKCKVLNSSCQNDLSHQILLDKLRKWNDVDIHIVSPSSWMNNKVAKSRIFKNKDYRHILNGIDLEQFKRNKKQNIDKYTLLVGALSPVSSPYKGYNELVNIMNIYAKTQPEYAKKTKLVFFGDCSYEQVRFDFPECIEIEALGVVKNGPALANIYSNADAYISTSQFDNLPTTIIEALACGTLSVCFDIGGIGDIIEHMSTGYLVKKNKYNDFIDGILWCLNADSSNAANLCRLNAENKFDMYTMAHSYKMLYEELV